MYYPNGRNLYINNKRQTCKCGHDKFYEFAYPKFAGNSLFKQIKCDLCHVRFKILNDGDYKLTI